MAGFCVTYDSLLRNNIKHVHYGKPALFTFRDSPEYPNMDQLRKIEQDRNLKRQLYSRVMMADTVSPPIPDAPAFRIINKKQVQDLVERLHRSTVAHPVTKDTLPPVDNKPLVRKGKSLSREEQDMLVMRLNAPTHVSKIRAQRHTDVIKVINQPIQDKKVCVRFAV